MELLAAIETVGVAHKPDLLEGVERPVDGRRRRLRVHLSTAVEELTAGEVSVGGEKDLDHRSPLRRPAHPPLVQSDAGAGEGLLLLGASDGHRGRWYIRTARRYVPMNAPA